MTYFTIKDLEAFSGIRKHTIRIWEQRYSFLQPRRSDTLRRVYTPKEVNVLLNVARLSQLGLRVSRIAKMVEEEKQPVISNKSTLQVKAIHDLIIAMAEMDTLQFSSVLKDCVDSWGIDDTVQEVIIPFCDRVGLLQKQEQKGFLDNILLVTELIRQKLYAAIDQANESIADPKTVLLCIIKGEQQELPVLYLYYLLKKEGYSVVYVGCNTTIDSLTALVTHKQPGSIITSQFEKVQRIELLQFAKKLPELSPHTKLLTIGNEITKAVDLAHYKHADTPAQALAMLLEE